MSTENFVFFLFLWTTRRIEHDWRGHVLSILDSMPWNAPQCQAPLWETGITKYKLQSTKLRPRGVKAPPLPNDWLVAGKGREPVPWISFLCVSVHLLHKSWGHSPPLPETAPTHVSLTDRGTGHRVWIQGNPYSPLLSLRWGNTKKKGERQERLIRVAGSSLRESWHSRFLLGKPCFTSVCPLPSAALRVHTRDHVGPLFWSGQCLQALWDNHKGYVWLGKLVTKWWKTPV